MYHFHDQCYTDSHPITQEVEARPSQTAAPAKVSRKPSTPAQAAENRGHRERALSKAIPAMRALFLCDVEPRIPPENAQRCAELFTLARVELAHLRKELGDLDQDRISEIAELFDVNRDTIDFLWFVTASYVEYEYTKRHQAASKKLADDGHAAIAHKRLIDLHEASHVFLKTPSRNDALFKKRPGRAGIHTGMPTVPIEGVTFVVVRGVPDGPGAGRFTTAERKAMAAELGVKIDTIRKAERERTPEAFDAWAEKRRKRLATRRREAAERIAKSNATDKRRISRKLGKTNAVRSYIAAIVAAGGRRYTMRHAFRMLKGCSTETILSAIEHGVFGYIHGKGDPASTTDVSDKEGVHPAFLDADKSTATDTDVSDNVSDKNASYPAKSHSFAPDHITIDDTVSPPEQNLETSDFLASVAAWKFLHGNHDAAVGFYHEDRSARRHELLERTRAGTVYGNQTVRDDAEHDDDLRHLEDGQEDALTAFLALDTAWEIAFAEDDRERMSGRRAA